MTDDPSLWFSIIIILIIGGYFSLAETAFAAADLIRIKVLAEKSPLAKRALRYIEFFDDSVIVTVIGSNFTSVLLSTLSTLFFVQLYQNNNLGSFVATIFSALLFYLFCDTIPKVIARGLPNQTTLFASSIFEVFRVVFFPLYLILRTIKKWLNRFQSTTPITDMTAADFSTIIEKQEAEGTLDAHEAELIQSAIEFSETAVKDVLTPIEKMIGLPDTALSDPLLAKQLIDLSFSRIPIYHETMQHIIGVLSVRTYFQNYQKNRQFDAKSILRKPYLVTAKITIDDLFEGYRKQRTHIAIVLDSQQRVIGMVTMEDVLEEIVGQIQETTKHTGIIRG
jgi:CBS domain containing-hemolysin-like protein